MVVARADGCRGSEKGKWGTLATEMLESLDTEEVGEDVVEELDDVDED